MRKEDISRLEAFEMKVWRRMEKISWTEHISNEVLKLVEEERSLLTIIRTRQRNWMGHIMTGDSLQSEIIEGRMDCKRGRRRPRKKLLDWMMSEEYNKLKEEAQHRESPMKPLEVCQRAENLKKKSSKIPINNYAATMVSAARRQIIGGGGPPVNKKPAGGGPPNWGRGGATRPAHSSTPRRYTEST